MRLLKEVCVWTHAAAIKEMQFDSGIFYRFQFFDSLLILHVFVFSLTF